MPRAILAASAHADRSRTVSSVADELGVSASTLRTWERRYGLGPERREAGSRRRYQPEDVERLRAMVNHMHAGLPAAEAAKRALADVSARPASGPLNAAQLRSVALADNLPRLEAALEAAVASHGLVHTWSRFVEPTLKSLRSTPGGDPVGCPPALMLLNAFQRVCRSVHLWRRRPRRPGPPRAAGTHDQRLRRRSPGTPGTSRRPATRRTVLTRARPTRAALTRPPVGARAGAKSPGQVIP